MEQFFFIFLNYCYIFSLLHFVNNFKSHAHLYGKRGSGGIHIWLIQLISNKTLLIWQLYSLTAQLGKRNVAHKSCWTQRGWSLYCLPTFPFYSSFSSTANNEAAKVSAEIVIIAFFQFSVPRNKTYQLASYPLCVNKLLRMLNSIQTINYYFLPP